MLNTKNYIFFVVKLFQDLIFEFKLVICFQLNLTIKVIEKLTVKSFVKLEK